MIGRYIVDFFCSSAKLANELDGSQHFEDLGLIQDGERTQWLQDNGIYVLRFLNSDVSNKLSDVCATIDTVVKERVEEITK